MPIPEDTPPDLRKKRKFVSLLQMIRQKVRDRIAEQSAQPPQPEDQ